MYVCQISQELITNISCFLLLFKGVADCDERLFAYILFVIMENMKVWKEEVRVLGTRENLIYEQNNFEITLHWELSLL